MVTRRTHFIPLFVTIARQHLDAVEQALIEQAPAYSALEAMTPGNTDPQLAQYVMALQMEVEKNALVVITFSAMAVEAYIYDYAARRLSDAIAKSLDKLEVWNKWVVTPQLVTGKPFPRDRQAYQLLTELIKERNNIIHHKSVNLSDDATFHSRMEQNKQQRSDLPRKARNAIKTLDLLADELQQVDPDELAVFMLRQSFTL